MKLPQSYVEMLNSGLNRPLADGARPYPIVSMEIMLLDHAQQKAHCQEAADFRQLCAIFDWQMSHRQQNHYLRQLKGGSTLVLTDPDKQIVWTSRNFLGMTGYRTAEAVGQKPSMLQGPDTDINTINQLREQLGRAESADADLLNYRKDGSTYRCHVHIDPLWNRQGELTHFLAVEREVA